MKFRFMGPCLTRIKIKPEQIVSIQEEYLSFWDHVENTFKESQYNSGAVAKNGISFQPEDIPHSHASLKTRQVLYQSVNADTPMLPAHAAQFNFKIPQETWQKSKQNIINNKTQYLEGLTQEQVTSLANSINLREENNKIRLYYSSLFVLHFDLQVAPELLEKLNIAHEQAAQLNAIEWFGMELFKAISKDVEIAFSDLLTDLSQNHKNSIDISPTGPTGWPPSVSSATNINTDSAPGRGPALWVTRSLFLEQDLITDNSVIPETLETWLAPVSQADWKTEIQQTGYSMQWLRYGFDEKTMSENRSKFDDAWESMLFSQFFWAAMETVEHEMFAVLGSLGTKTSGRPGTKQSYQKLLVARETAELTLAHYEHLKRYLTRTRVQLVEKIMNGWGFPSLVKNLREIIALCNQRHQTLLQKASAQSSFFTDILLFFIGTIAIIELMITMSITGRTLASDASLGLRDEGGINLLGLLSILPMDRLLISSCIIIGIILYFYVRHRSKQVL